MPFRPKNQRLRIYTGILGQIGDVVMFTPAVRRLKQLFPESEITFAVSHRYREVGGLVAGLPYVDRLFVTALYFERLTPEYGPLWEAGWPVDLRGEDEVAEQRRHDLVFETRPRHQEAHWWEHRHQVEEAARIAGIPGPLDLRTEVVVPAGTRTPPEARQRVVLHNDPAIDPRKAWPWDHVRVLARTLGPAAVVLLGRPGPEVPGALDLRGKTTLAEAAACVAACRAYVGIDSGLMWIAGSLRAPSVGLYGTSYIPAYGAIRPVNPNACYLQAEGSPAQITPEAVLAALQRHPPHN